MTKQKKVTKKPITLKESNKKFWAKTDAQKRVAIAKDVIKQINAKFFVAQKGVYGQVNLNKDPYRYDVDEIKGVPEQADESLKVIRRKGGVCDVCGIGGCFLSLVRLGDEMTISDAFSSQDRTTNAKLKRGIIDDLIQVDHNRMRRQLRRVFTPRQMTLIECAFEKSTMHSDAKDKHSPWELRDRAKEFGSKYSNDSKRLVAIMENIIKNKGELVL